MNKTKIKNFAIWARNKLRSEIAYKAGLLGINEKEIVEPLPQSTDDLQIFDIGTSRPVKLEGKTAVEQRKALANAIKAKRLPYSEAFDTVIEEVAYTWFNRLIAVRFMEVNEYLPSRVRVLSSENPDKAEPDFVTKPYDTDLEFTDEELDYIDECKDKSRLDELFQFLFIKQCNKLHDILPELFEQTNDYTELLLNVSFTDKDGIVWHLVHDIDEEDFNIEKEGQIEIIGWLYQYYNTELKSKVDADKKKGIRVSKEKLPAATQLFTPHWIVCYMVENSLGRTWTDIKPDTDLKSKWKYYLSEAEQSEDVQTKLLEMRQAKGQTSPEEITFFDPCMGSSHILVYAFDVFMAIYTSQGYTERDAVQKIIENNLYGLEIDDRAAQIAYFAVMMKARSYDRRFFTRVIRPNLCSIKESNIINPDYLELFGELKETARKLYDEFIDAKEYGSILNLKITADEISQLEEKCNEIIDNDNVYDNMFDTIRQVGIRTDFPALIRQAKIMVSRYDVVCTNPPYMGGGFSPKLDAYIKKNYADSKSDLFAVFIEKCGAFAKASGYYAMITQHAWMFLSSYEKLRKKLQYSTTVNMAHLGARAFDEISGEVVQTTAFVNQNQHIKNYLGTYARLIDGKSENEKSTMFLSGTYNYTANADNFSKIPGSPVAYWWNNSILNCFKGEDCSFGQPMKGIQTGKGEKFIRIWYEVSKAKTGFDLSKYNDIIISGKKWFPLTSGGQKRKWYGNFENIVNLENNGADIRNLPKNNYRLKNPDYYFCEGLTWTEVTTLSFSCRYLPKSILFGNGGPVSFFNSDLYYLIGLLNSKVVTEFFSVLAPTMNYGPDQVRNIPYIHTNHEKVINLVKENIQLSKADWDSFETSWDFEKHPLI